MMIQYNSTSNQSVIDDLGMGITSVLTHYITEEYIESLLVIRNDIVRSVKEIHLECLIEDLSTAEKTVLFRAAGVYIVVSMKTLLFYIYSIVMYLLIIIFSKQPLLIQLY